MHFSSQIFLLRELVWRDFAQRYAGSVLGAAWTFLNPLWQMLLLSFVFSLVMKIPLDSEPTERFWVFLLCGLLPWLAIHDSILRGTTAVTDNSEMVKKIRFPSEILVLSVTITALLQQVIAMALFVAALAFVGEISWATLPLLVPAMFLQTILTLGAGFFMATIHVFFRDTAQALGLLLNALFYLTPIVYPPSLVPEEYRGFIDLNPLVALMNIYRQAFLGGYDDWTDGLGTYVLISLVIFFGGLVLFRRMKPIFSDEL